MTITIGESQDNTDVHAQVGDTLEIRLSENATTGYRWALDNPDPALFAAGTAGAEYPGAALGSGGTAILRVRTLAKGDGTLRLKYWRSFEGDAGIVRRFSVKVHVS